MALDVPSRLSDAGRPADEKPRRRLDRPAGGLWLRLDERLRRLLDGANDDLAHGAGPPLLAAVFAAGIGAWFSWPSEPRLDALAALTAVFVVWAAWARRRGERAIGRIVFAAFLAGATVAAVGSWRAGAPRLDRERTVVVAGRVIDVDATAKGGTRLELAVARMEGWDLPPVSVPERVTATLAARAPAPAMGEAVSLTARLKPPEGPVLPGGYDFARRAWFEGRGAGGYVLGRAHPTDLGESGWTDRLLAPIGDLRHAVAERVRAVLPGGTGAIAAAIVVGEQRAIPESVGEPLRASGLTHIVSISGLHMSLVAGGVMVVLRVLLAMVPGLALRHPTRKWAAAAALVAATFYLLMSGMQVAALRSHIMVAIALLAVMVDRPAITMHTVAVAAVAIMLVDPESAMEPSFRMSFLAVIALVASWDLWQLRVAARPPRPEARGPVAHAVVSAWYHAEGLAFSSLIAGLATAPVIAGIFYRGAPYSILANMVVLPVVGMVVMPAAVVAFLLMPFGLDALPLWVMGLGIDWMVAVGRWTSALPGGGGLLGQPHALAMPLGIVAVLWLSLWRSRIRLFGLAPAAISLALLACGPRPDVWVGRHGSPVAVRGDDGRLHLLAGRDDAFDAAIWLAADADTRTPTTPGIADGWRCDDVGCAFVRDGGAGREPLRVVLVRDPIGFVADCGRADVVISTLAAPPGCAGASLVLDRTARATTGAATLTVKGRAEGSANAPAASAVPSSAPALRSASAPNTTASAGTSAAVGSVPVPWSPTEDGAPDAAAEAAARPDATHGPPSPNPLAVQRLAFEIAASLPREPRPWTPRDVLAARLAADVMPDVPDVVPNEGGEPPPADETAGVETTDSGTNPAPARPTTFSNAGSGRPAGPVP